MLSLRKRSWRAPLRLVVAAALGLAILAWPAGAPATHFPAATPLWGYQAAAANAAVGLWDIGTPADPFISSCVPAGGLVPPNAFGNGRGITHDPADGNLWYSVLNIGLFVGDGLIHKMNPSCTELFTIPFGDGPGGSVQDSIGAIDYDPDDGMLWVAGYQPIGGLSYLYKVNSATGAILDSCTVPFAGGGVGNDTLAEAKLSGLGGSGSYLLTDAGEVLTGLMAVDEATCTGGGAGTVVTTFTLPVGVTGIDYERGVLIATDLVSTIYSLGGPPFAAVVTSSPAAPGPTGLEDITLKSNRPPSCSTATVTPNLLWPPNHKLRTVTVIVTDPDGDVVTTTIDAVTQDEPVNGLGDGDTSPDAVAGPASNQVMLRAERSGLGDGRVYRISFTATDGFLSCTGTVTVGVPHDQGAGATPIDSAPPSYNSFGP
jgi:hypothetical protein